MEEQAPYGDHRRLKKRPSGQELEQALTRIREIQQVTKESLIISDDRKNIAVDPQNQVLLETCLESTMKITDLYFT